LPLLKRVALISSVRRPGLMLYSDVVALGEAVSDEALEERQASVTPDEVAQMQFTSGTTGFPKAVMLTHYSLVNQAHISAIIGDLRTDERYVTPMPLFHVAGCVGGVLFALYIGCSLIQMISFDPAKQLELLAGEKATFTFGVPTMLVAMLNHPRVQARKVDFSSIRACFSGSAPLLAATKARFEELSGGRIVEGYSLTEAMMACVVNPLGGTSKLGSVGLPLPDVEVAIVDPETGERRLPIGETGEILLRGPQLMSGYWDNPDETARTLRQHDSGAPWLHTGDLGYLDPDSYLFIVDRQKDLIKTSGYQVWPREVEEVLALHPGVMDVGVAGIADDVKGEVVKAWVVRRPGCAPTSDELRSHCRAALAPYKVPAQIEFRDSLPKTMTGKVLRRALKQ